MAALKRANDVRAARVELRRDIETGARRAADIILNPPADARTLPVATLLTWQHNWGGTRTRRLLASQHISDQRTLAQLTGRERHALAALLGGPAKPARQAWDLP